MTSLLLLILIIFLLIGFFFVKPVAWGRIDGQYRIRMEQNFKGPRKWAYEWAYRAWGGR